MNGARFASGDRFRASLRAKMTKIRIAVPMTWSRNAPPLAHRERTVSGQSREDALRLDGVGGIEPGDHLGIVPAHQQGSDERSRSLRQRVRRDLLPREALKEGQCDRHRRVEVRATDLACDVDPQRDAQAPGPGDAVVVAGTGGHHLRDDADPEQDDDGRPEELGDQFAGQSWYVRLDRAARVRCRGGYTLGSD